MWFVDSESSHGYRNRSRVMRGDLPSALPRVAQLAHALYELDCGRVYLLCLLSSKIQRHCAISDAWGGPYMTASNVGEAGLGSTHSQIHTKRTNDANMLRQSVDQLCPQLCALQHGLEQRRREQGNCRPQFGNKLECGRRLAVGCAARGDYAMLTTAPRSRPHSRPCARWPDAVKRLL
jgi:hypothetical protein